MSCNSYAHLEGRRVRLTFWDWREKVEVVRECFVKEVCASDLFVISSEPNATSAFYVAFGNIRKAEVLP